MRVAEHATKVTFRMKSHTKPALRVMPAERVQISPPTWSVLSDSRHAVLGWCIDDGQTVVTAMIGADWGALHVPEGVPNLGRRAGRGCTAASSFAMGGQRITVRRP